MGLFDPLSTDWFTFLFWEIRKSRLGKGGAFESSAIHLVRGEGPPATEDTRTLAEDLGWPMRLQLRHGSFADPLAPVPFGLIPLNRALGALPVYDLEDRWSSPDEAHRDLGRMFGRPPDPSWGGVHDDGVLARLATAGLGAHLLRRRAEGGFEIDLRRMSRYAVREPFLHYGARLLLSSRFAPEAIEREGTLARPGDPAWETFTLAFEASLAAWTTTADHSLTCHFAMAGTLILALRLGLPEAHPLRDALTPFTFATTAVNSSGIYSLLAEGAYFTRLFGFTHEGLCDLLADAAADLRFQTFPELLASQGLTADLDSLPFASDALLWWNALDRFIADLLHRWAPPGDPALPRLVETWMELLPQARFDATDPRAALRRMLGTALFWITVMHEHVGDMIWYVQDPTWMPVKIRRGDASAQSLWKHDAVAKMILGVLTAEVEMPKILDDLSHAFPDTAMRAAWASFQSDLGGVGSEIAARNARRAVAYPMLAPERIHVSVSL